MNDIAICWQDESRIASLANRGSIPIHCLPRQASIPGAVLALVRPNGEILLKCKVQKITYHKSVKTADGVSRSGYLIYAKPRSMKTSTSGQLGKIPFRFRVIGQLRYFDAAAMSPLTIFGWSDDPKFLAKENSEGSLEMVTFKPYAGGIPNLDRSDPEAALVTRYVKWIGRPDKFCHAQVLPSGHYTDLFNNTKWTLIEAKSSVRENVIREAFGQLHDYKRVFRRTPRLAVLTPRRPSPRSIEFLSHFNVLSVWETESGKFSDSRGGELSADLRRLYRGLK